MIGSNHEINGFAPYRFDEGLVPEDVDTPIPQWPWILGHILMWPHANLDVHQVTLQLLVDAVKYYRKSKPRGRLFRNFQVEAFNHIGYLKGMQDWLDLMKNVIIYDEELFHLDD